MSPPYNKNSIPPSPPFPTDNKSTLFPTYVPLLSVFSIPSPYPSTGVYLPRLEKFLM